MARALKRCAEGGFAGQMWLVNPQHAELEGVPCVASVADLPCGPDAAFVATNRELTSTRSPRSPPKAPAGDSMPPASPKPANRAWPATPAAGRRRRNGAARPELLRLARLPARRRAWPVAHGGRQVERGVAVLTQSGNFAYNPVDERPFAAGGLYGIGGQPGAAGHRRADGRAARRAAGDCHRPASGRSEERPGSPARPTRRCRKACR